MDKFFSGKPKKSEVSKFMARERIDSFEAVHEYFCAAVRTLSSLILHEADLILVYSQKYTKLDLLHMLLDNYIDLSNKQYNGGYENSIFIIKLGLTNFLQCSTLVPASNSKNSFNQNFLSLLENILTLGQNAVGLMQKGFSEFVTNILLVLVSVLNGYSMFPREFSHV